MAPGSRRRDDDSRLIPKSVLSDIIGFNFERDSHKATCISTFSFSEQHLYLPALIKFYFHQSFYKMQMNVSLWIVEKVTCKRCYKKPRIPLASLDFRNFNGQIQKSTISFSRLQIVGLQIYGFEDDLVASFDQRLLQWNRVLVIARHFRLRKCFSRVLQITIVTKRRFIKYIHI